MFKAWDLIVSGVSQLIEVNYFHPADVGVGGEGENLPAERKSTGKL